MLYKDLFGLLRYLAQFDNLEELNLITNAVSIDDTAIKNLTELPKLTSVKISLESHIPKINDSIRGEGHFRCVWDNIAKIHNAGITVVLMVTLGKWNCDAIPNILELAFSNNISQVIFERFVPIGNGKKLLDDSMTATQWGSVVETILKELEIEISAEELLPYRAFMVSNSNRCSAENRLAGALCNLGPESMALMPDATVYPCRRLPIVVGKLPQNSMEQIIELLKEYAPQRLLSQMRGGICASCIYEECAGCRALSVALKNGLYGDDFQCPVIKSG